MIVPQSHGTQRPQDKATDLNTLQRDLAHFERQASLVEMSSALTHEINQPLTALMGYAQSAQLTLRNGKSGADPACETIGRLIDKLLEQALRLRDTLVHRGYSPSPCEEPLRPVEINTIAHDARSVVCAEFGEQRLRIDLYLDAERPTVEADPMALLCAIVGLARNAIEAMAGNRVPRVTIETKVRSKDQIEVAVSDSGAGLAASQRERMFHPFVSNKPGRLGLGLAICHRIVSILGGGLSAEPIPSGGTVIRMLLPGAPYKGYRDA